MRKCYHNLKGNAKRRNKIFNLTYEQFAKFAIKCKLLHSRGRNSESYSVDRINEDGGYTIHNIQRLTLAENTAKSNRTRKVQYDHQTKYGSVVEVNNNVELNQPF